jgi:hypothetical protein
LVDGIVASRKFDALHVEHKALLEKNNYKDWNPLLALFLWNGSSPWLGT